MTNRPFGFRGTISGRTIGSMSSTGKIAFFLLTMLCLMPLFFLGALIFTLKVFSTLCLWLVHGTVWMWEEASHFLLRSTSLERKERR